MNDRNLLVICDEGSTLDFEKNDDYEPVFLLQNNKHFCINETNEEVLKYLVFSIRRKPKNLLTHLQRIMMCYQRNNEAQLYASLVDFFMVLQDSGLAIKKRVLAGARNQLSSSSVQSLLSSLNNKGLLQGNSYSVLTPGIESSDALVSPAAVVDAVESNHDPLVIAHDYIEYSQLEEARIVLEEAILSTPERAELHKELLELYQATRNVDAFNSMLLALSKINHPMEAQWSELNAYFNHK